MNIKSLILNAAPYGLVRKYKQKKQIQSLTFWNEYVQYLHSGIKCSFAVESPAKTVVSVQGFGYSGSGAVVDLLREYDQMVVIGNVDNEGSLSAKNERKYELNFLRAAGGLFEIERFLDVHNNNQVDAVLHRYMLLVQHSDFYREIQSCRKYLYEFLNQISTYYVDSIHCSTNTHLNYEGMNSTLYFKKMSIYEYRELCSRLLYSLFECYHVAKNEMLVLDQFVGDHEYDFGRYKDYVPNLKPIIVYRDPRDVYVFAKAHGIFWIPTSAVETYIDWYVRKTCYINIESIPGFYVTSFERLISEYKTVVAEIEDFLSLDSKNHIHPFENFNPAVSAQGVGIWKKYPELVEDCDKIKKALDYLIYYKD